MDKELQSGIIDALLEVAAKKEVSAKHRIHDAEYKKARTREVDILFSLAELVERWDSVPEDVRIWQFRQLSKRCGAPPFLMGRISEKLQIPKDELDQNCA